MQQSPYKHKTGPKRVFNALAVSLHGLVAAFRHEAAFRLELLLAAILIPVALALDTNGPTKALLIACVLLVLIVEVLNSAIEAVVDRVSLDLHPMAKRAKDLGSAAVFLSLVNLAAVWAAVLLI
jgi:diacylglycerol kinase (ATP)